MVFLLKCRDHTIEYIDGMETHSGKKMAKSKILIIDDEIEIRKLLNAALSEKYEVIEAEDGVHGIELAQTTNPSLILLDLMMPRLSGFDVCIKLKTDSATRNTPIIVLTGSSETENLVESFNLGADDFVEKPFKLEELKARISSKLKTNLQEKLSCGDINIDLKAMTVSVREKIVPFSTLEFNILHFFVKHAGHVVSREKVLDEIWNSVTVSDRTVDTHIVSLRKKIAESHCKLNTIYGAGYKLSLPNEDLKI